MVRFLPASLSNLMSKYGGEKPFFVNVEIDTYHIVRDS
jgi:hypothetical protein